MNTRHAQSQLPQHEAARFGIAVVIGLGAALLGTIAGFIVGANIGGNWATSFSIGSLHGYEATAMLGAALGAILLGLTGFWFALRHRPSGSSP